MRDFEHKVIFMTDIHITSPGNKIIGLDPIKRFSLCLAHAAKNHPDAVGLILVGDLTHDGTPKNSMKFLKVLYSMRLGLCI